MYCRTSLRVLLVEDNPGDVALMREALNDFSVPVDLAIVADGAEALDYLYRRGPYASALRPHLIFLDLNLPKVDGRQVLAVIKQDPGLRRIPTVVFTTSQSREDVAEAYSLQANCYVSKPVKLSDYLAAVHGCEEFWLQTARLPEN